MNEPATNPIVAAGEQMLARNAKQAALRRAEETQEYYRARASTAVTPVAPVIGRNDPCQCGSGRKYKKCCSSDNPTLHNEEREKRRTFVKTMFEEKQKVPPNETEQQRAQRTRALLLMAAYLGMT